MPAFVLRRTQKTFRAPVVTIDSPDELPIRWPQFLLLFAVLPLFGEVFHYLKVLPPMWALSKAFPIITLPLCFFAMKDGPAPRGSRQMLLSLLYLFLVPSFTAIFSFQQDFFLGLTAQVKLLPILYFFSFTGLLRLLKPTSSEIAKGFLYWGLLLFAVLVLLWILVPQSVYEVLHKAGDAPMFSHDSRGNRIRMPYLFGTIGIFYCFRRYFAEKNVKWLLATIVGFVSVIGLIRMRAAVLGLSLVFAINMLRFSKPKTRIVVLALLPFAGAALLSVPYVASTFNTGTQAGFDLRNGTIERAIAFLGNNPLRWAIGVGTITPLDTTGLIRYFNHSFFLADITWLGIVFEYGLIGAVLLLMIPVRGLWESRHVRASRQGAFLGSLQDYLIYSLLISTGYPLTMAPGEFAMILAILVHESARYGANDPRFRYS
ncbi:hypothetical protein [Terriglobus sp. ADX1]|uniref:hypothetical protein n=1 Tax=Terriglobus sp. ADX1 TaxID=2794063 RepID=UPI002FE653C3